MTRPQLRSRVGMILVFGHLIIVCAVIVLTVIRRTPFAPGEGTTAVALVVPIFAANVAEYLAGVVKDQQAQTGATPPAEKAPRGEFILFSILFPTLLVIYLLVTIYLKTTADLNFEQFKWMVAAGEALFGVYTNLFVKALLERA